MTIVPQYDSIAFGEAALKLRSYRQELIASNLVNADTPGYKAKDIAFGDVLRQQMSATSMKSGLALSVTSNKHLQASHSFDTAVQFRQAVQPALDGNTVDPDVERTEFAKNSFMTEATLNFLSSSIRSRLSAISGQPS
ncbi:flagellar basal body rod protein FlgB [Polynucleobacter sp. 30F-ANTBAC]|jgi:flagellar basal-body rod protein FlgB|uniref:flagellar basal body rod protein FlgB n=1 Tax=Polynucleobacter sp. 30F-ANTBAC TaxID=2689095 RepID=UPI001C0CF6EB|nr:flagellar basal body rod protein FlgB [Polynucleobacter sp. 30F-ANTBAC]MBU3599759.1 flagellar basal body rod protein FlgB [Polynucleobacter sp. 30F-ANTBAC]